MFHREGLGFSSTFPGGSPSNHSAFSNVRNLSISKPIFNITQAQTVNQSPNPTNDQKVVDWLSPVNYKVVQNDTFSKHTAGTGRWFIEHPKFRRWLSGTIPVLCAKGPPGVGKTILSSIVIRHLERSFSNNREDIAIIFAYCRYTDQLSVTDILASFVKQLVDHHSRLLSFVESFDRNHLMDETPPIDQDWLELLQTLIPLFNRAYIVVDALDEFPDNTRDGLLNALESLKASLLITSRPSNAFHLLRDVEYIEIGDENGQDIEMFIHQKFRESSNLTSLLREKELVRKEICSILKETSKNMFLVATLQIESLKDSTTVNQLRKAANLLSSEIDDIYAASWERIKAQSKERVSLAEGAIIWLTYAYRPLKIAELQHAIAVHCDGETFDTDDIANEEMIVSVCCGLITIDRESRIVRLVHFTALDFFKRLGQSLCSTPHTLISTRCVSYLSALKFPMSGISTWIKLKGFLGAEEHPFRDYAYHHWGSHAVRCYEEDGLPNAIPGFLLQCVHYPCIMEGGNFDLFERCHIAVYYGIRDQSVLSNEWYNRITLLNKSTPLILASGRGHVDIVNLILSYSVNINAQNERGQTALMKASLNGYGAVVELLLSQTDIAINTQSKEGATALMAATQNGHSAVVELLLSQTNIAVNTQTEYGSTALILASQNGHDTVVKLLLSRPDIAVNTQDELGWTALILASKNGHSAVVNFLLSRPDIAVNTQDKDGWTALILASKNGHDAVVKRLLSQTDLGINMRSMRGSTALIMASQNGHDAVVKLLLSRTDNATNTRSKQGATALMKASQNGHDAVVKLLLPQPNIGINMQSIRGSTALILASQNGHDTVVELLLSQTDIAINTQSKHGATALILASQNGHGAVVKLLLSQTDISINTQSNRGATALILASQKGHDTVVKFLLSWTNIDVNAQTEDGSTALMVASQNGHDAVVKLLLFRPDIVVNTQDEHGWTALILASWNGHDTVVNLLLSWTSIDVNAQTEDGSTALMVASQNGHDTVVKLLLSRPDIVVNIQDEHGWTALILASWNGHDTVVNLLLSRNDIAINTQSNEGTTALMVASQNGHDGVVKLLTHVTY